MSIAINEKELKEYIERNCFTDSIKNSVAQLDKEDFLDKMVEITYELAKNMFDTLFTDDYMNSWGEMKQKLAIYNQIYFNLVEKMVESRSDLYDTVFPTTLYTYLNKYMCNFFIFISTYYIEQLDSVEQDIKKRLSFIIQFYLETEDSQINYKKLFIELYKKIKENKVNKKYSKTAKSGAEYIMEEDEEEYENEMYKIRSEITEMKKELGIS